MNRDNLFDPTNVVSVPTNDFAKIGLAFETTIVLSFLNLSGTIVQADSTMLHDRSHLSHFHRLMRNVHLMLSLAVRKTTVFVQFGIVHEPISSSETANVNVFFARI